MRASFFKFVFTFLLISFQAFAEEGYNEIFDSNGQVRPEYQAVYKLWQDRHAQGEKEYLTYSRKVFTGDNALDPMPRILLASDYDNLKHGVEQRARAIRAFLKDHYSGRKYYAQAQAIPQEVVDRIIARSGEAGYKGLIDPKSISFFYGPDIIKDSKGTWRVIEDNMGFIGGVGDLKLAQDITLKTYPEIKEHLAPRPAQDFYVKLAHSYKERAKQYGGKAIVYMIPTYAADNEDKRIAQIFAEQGIETVTPNTVKQLKITDDGVFMQLKGPGSNSLEKVGFIFMNGEHSWMDPTHPASVQRALIEEASSLLKEKKISPKIKTQIADILNSADPVTHIPDLQKLRSVLDKTGIGIDKAIARKNAGLLDVILKGKVGANYTPGIDFIGDKEFYVYVEDLVRLYLHEEPIIKNIETKKFNEGASNKTNEALIKTVFDHLNDYVIKKVDGRGGDSVWVGPKVQANDVPALINAIRENPDMYIVQKFTPLSTLNENIVDLRVITDVSPEGIYVTDTPWGRGLPKNGNGKVNLSDKGREITVLVTPKQRFSVNTCQGVFAF